MIMNISVYLVETITTLIKQETSGQKSLLSWRV